MQVPLLAELSRRRVFRALVGYGIVAFAVLQVLEPVMHGLHWPEAVLSYAVVALAIGFPLVMMLAWIFDVKASGSSQLAPAADTGRKRFWLTLGLAGIGVFVAGPGLIYYFAARAQKQRRPVPIAAPSIAVLPFVNMSSDRETEYFSDGITEELINSLSNVDGLRVVSRTAVFALKGKTLGIDQLGSQLKANLLLEGSVRREGNALRITAQLIDVADGYHLWSKSYDREVRGIFALEDEIARSIAGTLQRKLVRQEAAKPATSSQEAHDLYLKGRYFLNKRNLEAFRKAAGFFEHAIQVDPEYALAYTGLADAIALRTIYDAVPGSELSAMAKIAARKALDLDPGLAEAHTSLANIASNEWDWPTALEEFRAAIELKPDYATARQWYAETLAYMGRLQEAEREIQRALELDPTSLIINTVAGSFRALARDYDGALERFGKTLDMEPGFDRARWGVVHIYMLQGRLADAIRELEDIRSATPVELLGTRGRIAALMGRRAEAVGALHELERISRREYVRPIDPALISIALGDYDRAFALLQKGCMDRDASMLYVKLAPVLDTVRSDPRFTKLLECMRLE